MQADLLRAPRRQPANLFEPLGGEHRAEVLAHAGRVARRQPVELREREERQVQPLGSDDEVLVHAPQGTRRNGARVPLGRYQRHWPTSAAGWSLISDRADRRRCVRTSRAIECEISQGE